MSCGSGLGLGLHLVDCPSWGLQSKSPKDCFQDHHRKYEYSPTAFLTLLFRHSHLHSHLNSAQEFVKTCERLQRKVQKLFSHCHSTRPKVVAICLSGPKTKKARMAQAMDSTHSSWCAAILVEVFRFFRTLPKFSNANGSQSLGRIGGQWTVCV